MNFELVSDNVCKTVIATFMWKSDALKMAELLERENKGYTFTVRKVS